MPRHSTVHRPIKDIRRYAKSRLDRRRIRRTFFKRGQETKQLGVCGSIDVLVWFASTGRSSEAPEPNHRSRPRRPRRCLRWRSWRFLGSAAAPERRTGEPAMTCLAKRARAVHPDAASGPRLRAIAGKRQLWSSGSAAAARSLIGTTAPRSTSIATSTLSRRRPLPCGRGACAGGKRRCGFARGVVQLAESAARMMRPRPISVAPRVRRTFRQAGIDPS